MLAIGIIFAHRLSSFVIISKGQLVIIKESNKRQRLNMAGGEPRREEEEEEEGPQTNENNDDNNHDNISSNSSNTNNTTSSANNDMNSSSLSPRSDMKGSKWGRNIIVGNQYDVLDSTGYWCEAEVNHSSTVFHVFCYCLS